MLGGALGNVFDRVRYGHVIDFIDVHMFWKETDHHWPTFNVADIAICVGVGLMAIDMFTSKRAHPPLRAPRVPPALSGEPAVDWNGAAVEPPLPQSSSPPQGAPDSRVSSAFEAPVPPEPPPAHEPKADP